MGVGAGDYAIALFVLSMVDTLGWATGTHVGASNHVIGLFYIEYGRDLGLYFDILHFEV